MTYFEFYGMPETLLADPKLVKQQYYAMSKKYHPDFFANESAEKQAEILEMSTLNTKAYQTLSQPDRLIQYVLALHGLLDESKPGTLPNDFLMEMMELNEEIADAQADADTEGIKLASGKVQALENSLLFQIQPVLETYQNAAAPEKESLLLKVKDYYLKKKYLLRLRESLSKIAAPNSH